MGTLAAAFAIGLESVADWMALGRQTAVGGFC